MNKKKFELVLAAVLFIVGFFLLIFSQRGATGAVIGIVDIGSMTSMFIGLLFVISALVLYAGGKELENVIAKENLSGLKNAMGLIDVYDQIPKGKKIVLLDESVFEKEGEIKELTDADRAKLRSFLSHYDKIYTSHHVLNQLDEKTKRLLGDYHCNLLREDFVNEKIPGSEQYFKMSRTLKAAKGLEKYIKGGKPENEKEMCEVGDNLMTFLPALKSVYGIEWTPDKARGAKDIFKGVLSKSVPEFIPDDNDKEIITTADALAHNDKDAYVFICSANPSLQYAVKEMPRVDPDLRDRVHYVNLRTH